MSKFIINGGKKLSGTINVNGSKNAALPLIAASLLTTKETRLRNVPPLRDVNNLLKIVEAMGVKVETTNKEYIISPQKINVKKMPRDIVGQLRGSILLIGGLLGRTKKITLPLPGGDIIGARPVDVHLDGLEQLGAKVKQHKNTISIDGRNMKAGTVILKEFSVTATENIMMVAASLPGKTTIHIAANEPHIINLARMLSKMGAKVRGAGTHTITIEGKKNLGGASINVIPDMLEAGLFILLNAATKSEATVKNVPVEYLPLFFKKLDDIGLNYEISGKDVTVKPSKLKSFKVQTLPHPGIATDLQAPFSVVATQAKGASLIHDPMYESRFKHCEELIKMGAKTTVCDPHRVIIEGPNKLHGKEIKSLDIRSGATLIMAGLVAKGQTTINDAEIIERGYYQLPERLQKIGADITLKS